jgi:DNA-binding Xre family transcriptional regulator
MITYDRLWVTMKKKGISQYKLIMDYNFSRGQIFRLKHNCNVNTNTLNTICNILDCNIEDIIEFTKDENIIY